MLTAVKSAAVKAQGIALTVWQDDSAPVIVGGNKRFKLAAVFNEAEAQGATGVLTLGGAWSNHIHAIAYQARQREMASVGIVRGETTDAANATLTDASRYGMKLQFVSRKEYRQRHDASYLQQLQRKYPDFLLVPEGGSTASAAIACGAILDEMDPQFVSGLHTVACAVGTGATICGLQRRLGANQFARGYTVVKDPSRATAMQRWLNGTGDAMPVLVPVYKPQYGQMDAELLQFIDNFYLAHNILLDPLYTGKMMRQLLQDIEQGMFPAGTGVLALHTGGLQGWRGLLPQSRDYLSKPILTAIETISSDQTSRPGNE